VPPTDRGAGIDRAARRYATAATAETRSTAFIRLRVRPADPESRHLATALHLTGYAPPSRERSSASSDAGNPAPDELRAGGLTPRLVTPSPAQLAWNFAPTVGATDPGASSRRPGSSSS
jgi:hypothetical protein